MLLRLCCVYVALISTVTAAESYWVSPSPSGSAGSMVGNIDITLGSVFALTWFSNVSSYSITMFQQQAGNNGADYAGTIYTANGDGLGTVRFNWLVDVYRTDLNKSSIYYLYLDFGNPGAISCHYFNVKRSELVQTSSALPSMSSTAISATSSTASPTLLAVSTTIVFPSSQVAPTSTSTTSSEPISTAAASSQGSATTSIALGVGLGAGLLILLAVVIWLAKTLLRRRARSTKQTISHKMEAQDLPYAMSYHQHTDSKMPVSAYHSGHEDKAGLHHRPYELPTHLRSPVEVPGNSTWR